MLAGIDLGNEWVALHSLNCSDHDYKQWSEIDFLLVGPEGMFVLEVKGGGVSYTDGQWRYMNRYGQVNINPEGPFNQAKSARFALEKVLREKFDLDGFSKRPVFGFGVVFPDTPWDAESPEMPRELVADSRRCVSSEQFGRYLRSLLTYWKGKFPADAGLTSSDRKKAVQILRPNVDLYPPFTLRLGQVTQQMQTLTEEQFERLDIIEANRQAIISGGAGTGKTFLLMQAARREAARGKSVLVVTESGVLASYLRKLEPNRDIRIMELAQITASPPKLFDVLFVDEGQDLLSLDSMELLSGQISGGLEDGTWRWFMDENNQAHIRGRFDQEALEMLRQGVGRYSPVYLPLRQNVRNTKEIITSVESWTGARLGKTKVMGHGELPRVIQVTGIEQAAEALEGRLEQLQELDVPLDEIAVIASDKQLEALRERLHPNWRKKTLILDVTTVRAGLKNKAVFGTPAGFKGLERPVVVVIDLKDDRNHAVRASETYVASTRANYDLTVITDTSSSFGRS